jgi:hypothetical protein
MPLAIPTRTIRPKSHRASLASKNVREMDILLFYSKYLDGLNENDGICYNIIILL